MFIDKKGKLFGKINIIDFLVLLVLVVAIAVVGIKVFNKEPITFINKDQDTLEIKFYIEEVDTWVAEKVKKGDVLYDATYDQEVGEVTRVEIDDAKTWGLDANGQYVMSTRKSADGQEMFKSMTITGEVKGEKTDTGAEINGKRYGVGHSMVLYAGDAKMYLRVRDISVKE